MTLSPHLSMSALTAAMICAVSQHTFAQQPNQLDVLVLQAKGQPELQLDARKSLLESPQSIQLVQQQHIEQAQLKVLSDLIQQDSGLNTAYTPIGYYGNLQSRGFAFDSSSSYLINGQTVRGEQDIAFENKQQVEILKGTAALLSPIATPGGVINYVTKRPEQIKTLNLNANEYGQVAAHLDLGGFSGADEQLGYRINLAAEKLKPYVQEADGERYFAALALDYQLDPQAQLEFDLEWQQKSQYSVPGYQLFNGQLPKQVDWDHWLGQQAWSIPVKNDSLSTSLKYQYTWSDAWYADMTASLSHVVLDDYSSFPWGCYSEICDIQGLGNQFDSQGNYDLYDFRSPDKTHRVQQFQTNLYGQWAWNQWQHQLQLGLEYSQKRQRQHTAINEWVGVANTHTRPPQFAPSQAELGPRYTALKSQQQSLHVLDHIQWHPQWSAALGFKWLSLDEQAYDAEQNIQRNTQKNKFLPQLALMYQPWDKAYIYASYREGLSPGGVAPWFADNAFVSLAPRHSQQYELGYKQQWQDWLISSALFHLEQDYQYTQANATGFSYVQQGKQRSQGVEFMLQGQLADHWSVNANATWLKAQVRGVPAFKDKQMQNIPKWSAVLQLAYQVPQVEGLHMYTNARYSDGKFVDKTATVQVPSYVVMDVGGAYDFQWQGYPMQISMNLDNLTNKKYWRDVGDYMGDDYLFLSQPRTLKMATKIQF